MYPYQRYEFDKLLNITNRIIIIEYKLPSGIMNYNKCINTTLPFYSIQIIYPFPDLKISANYDKVEGHSDNGEALLKRIKTLL